MTNEETLDAVSCLMMSDTGLYLNWSPTKLMADEDEESSDSEPWSEDDHVGRLNFLGIVVFQLN